jgi:UDP-2-acetamido-2-deoxy-ribo-hexuluronate aminotransferase
MEFINLKAQQKRIKEQLNANIQRVLAHGQYIMGPEIKELEKKLAAYVGVKHAIGCASGTDALLMALMAYGVSPGDAIFTTPFTFIATAEVISLLGATPVFVDIDPKTYNIDPDKLDLAIQAVKTNDRSLHPLPLTPNASRLTPKAIIPVDLFGLTADYDAIDAIAKKHNLFVIEDAAQSFGAEYKGKKSCAFGHIACTSFFPPSLWAATAMAACASPRMTPWLPSSTPSASTEKAATNTTTPGSASTAASTLCRRRSFWPNLTSSPRK